MYYMYMFTGIHDGEVIDEQLFNIKCTNYFDMLR